VSGPPPKYVALVKRLAALIPQWCSMHPTADLRWIAWEGAVFCGNLQSPFLVHLAATSDAAKLLEWLDERTNREGTLLQARIALELCGRLAPEYSAAPEFAAAFRTQH